MKKFEFTDAQIYFLDFTCGSSTPRFINAGVVTGKALLFQFFNVHSKFSRLCGGEHMLVVPVGEIQRGC